MGLTSTVGRLLLAAIFLFSGVEKLQKPQPVTGYLVQSYEAVHTQFVKQTQLVLPEQLVFFKIYNLQSPTFIKQHASLIIQVVAGVEILGAVLVILNFFFGGFLLSLFVLGTIALFHNPLVFNKTPEYYNMYINYREQLFHTTQALKNLALVGGLLLVGVSSKAVVEPTTKKSKKTT